MPRPRRRQGVPGPEDQVQERLAFSTRTTQYQRGCTACCVAPLLHVTCEAIHWETINTAHTGHGQAGSLTWRQVPSARHSRAVLSSLADAIRPSAVAAALRTIKEGAAACEPCTADAAGTAACETLQAFETGFTCTLGPCDQQVWQWGRRRSSTAAAWCRGTPR